jgi:hypothetical protein
MAIWYVLRLTKVQKDWATVALPINRIHVLNVHLECLLLNSLSKQHCYGRLEQGIETEGSKTIQTNLEYVGDC